MFRHGGLPALLTAMAWIGSLSGHARAGWWGPSNYDECVLESMKGQPKYMLKNAEQSCRQKFPESVLLNDYITSSWCEVTNTELVLCVTHEPSNYQIEEVIGYFSSEPDCANDTLLWPLAAPNDELRWKRVKGKKSYFSGKVTFDVPPGEYLCKLSAFYGIPR